jgi:chromosome segregation ATPase
MQLQDIRSQHDELQSQLAAKSTELERVQKSWEAESDKLCLITVQLKEARAAGHSESGNLKEQLEVSSRSIAKLEDDVKGLKDQMKISDDQAYNLRTALTKSESALSDCRFEIEAMTVKLLSALDEQEHASRVHQQELRDKCEIISELESRLQHNAQKMDVYKSEAEKATQDLQQLEKELVVSFLNFLSKALSLNFYFKGPRP